MIERKEGDILEVTINGKEGIKKFMETPEFKGLFKGKVVYAAYQHDDWCKTLKSGDVEQCNCDPRITLKEMR